MNYQNKRTHIIVDFKGISVKQTRENDGNYAINGSLLEISIIRLVDSQWEGFILYL